MEGMEGQPPLGLSLSLTPVPSLSLFAPGRVPSLEWKNGRAMEQHGAVMQGMKGMEGAVAIRSISLFCPRPCSLSRSLGPWATSLYAK